MDDDVRHTWNRERWVIDRLVGARLLEAEPHDLQRWGVRIDPDRLDAFSDAAVNWVLAHELAHVASGLPTDPLERDDSLAEDRADHFALLWGFEREKTAFDGERERHEQTRQDSCEKGGA